MKIKFLINYIFHKTEDYSIKLCILNVCTSFSSTKIRPQAKIDNFAFKNSNIIIEGLF